MDMTRRASPSCIEAAAPRRAGGRSLAASVPDIALGNAQDGRWKVLGCPWLAIDANDRRAAVEATRRRSLRGWGRASGVRRHERRVLASHDVGVFAVRRLEDRRGVLPRCSVSNVTSQHRPFWGGSWGVSPALFSGNDDGPHDRFRASSALPDVIRILDPRAGVIHEQRRTRKLLA